MNLFSKLSILDFNVGLVLGFAPCMFIGESSDTETVTGGVAVGWEDMPVELDGSLREKVDPIEVEGVTSSWVVELSRPSFCFFGGG